MMVKNGTVGVGHNARNDPLTFATYVHKSIPHYDSSVIRIDNIHLNTFSMYSMSSTYVYGLSTKIDS